MNISRGPIGRLHAGESPGRRTTENQKYQENQKKNDKTIEQFSLPSFWPSAYMKVLTEII